MPRSETARAEPEWLATPSVRRREANLLDIWPYIAQHSPRAADRLLDRIESQCRLLADNPRLGRPRPEIAPDALYREQHGGIEVVRVVHGAREIEQIEF